MSSEYLALPYIIKHQVHHDHRGWFLESYNSDKMALPNLFVQDNHSFSEKKGTIRGLHFQLYPYSQAKFIRVIKGRILDVVVDLRPSSNMYLKYFSFELNELSRETLYIPKGFAHGFLTLEDQTEVIYKVDEYYHPEYEFTLKYDDPNIGIDWQFDFNEVIFSDKDKNGLTLDEVIILLGDF